MAASPCSSAGQAVRATEPHADFGKRTHPKPTELAVRMEKPKDLHSFTTDRVPPLRGKGNTIGLVSRAVDVDGHELPSVAHSTTVLQRGIRSRHPESRECSKSKPRKQRKARAAPSYAAGDDPGMPGRPQGAPDRSAGRRPEGVGPRTPGLVRQASSEDSNCRRRI
jgi:hypothetical protein